MAAVLALAASCSVADGARELVGIDPAGRPEVCVVVAPRDLPAADLEARVHRVVDEVARTRGRLTVLVADGPSATAFPLVDLGTEANGGDFGSRAANPAARARDADRAAAAARARIAEEVRAVAGGPAPQPHGLDLLGGIDQCARRLRPAGDNARLVTISHGIHRTVDLPLADRPDEARRLPELLAHVAAGDFDLELFELGRTATPPGEAPVARRLIDAVVAGWESACARLGSRCRHPVPGPTRRSEPSAPSAAPVRSADSEETP